MQRKTVTVLFCDVTGSTALGESVDPEALRALLARYFERMKAIVERHGGTVEKFGHGGPAARTPRRAAGGGRLVVRGPVGALLVLAAIFCTAACGSSEPKLAPPPKVTNFALQSKLLGRPLYEVLVTPAGGGKGRPLLVFLHGYGAAPSDVDDPAFRAALRRLGDRAPVVLLPEGDVGWWYDRPGEPWGSYVLREAIPAALRRSGADPHRVAIGGISMGGFGALDLGRLAPTRFCAVGGHSPAVFTRGSDEISFAFDSAAAFAHHDLIGIARRRSPYRAPVWIDVGDRDHLRPAATTLARELKADGADVSFHVWPGAHEGRYWDAHFAQYLRFYADACAR